MRQAQRASGETRKKETLFEAEREPLYESGVQRIDRHDRDLPHDEYIGFAPKWNLCSKLTRGREAAVMIVGIGTDLAEVARYRFDATRLARFAQKVYTDEEMQYALAKRNWPERLAGFFAAKEAARKAFGHAIPWRRVGVSHERSGKPILRFYDAYADLPARRGITRVHLTITHTSSMASAVVVLEAA